jgi:TonB-dependent SusC/RagA subfamily outer membrane receptor
LCCDPKQIESERLMAKTGLVVPILLAAAPFAVWGQTGAVAGRVSTEHGDAPVAAAQVTIPGSNAATLTGVDGSFTLTGVAPGRYELRVNRIGYRVVATPIEVVADQTVRANVRITEVPLALDEIVVTGTVGQARRREVGNSIAQIRAADIAQPVQNLETMLQGRTAGIVIPSGTADMGSGQAIRLRGNASLSLTSYPLVYIDGIRQTGSGYRSTRSGGQTSMISDIDPATIERVEIIKGPAATALYGTEAAAGVMQIFTKKGSSGRTVWTFQTDQGVRWVQPWGSEPGRYSEGLLDTALSGTATKACIALHGTEARSGCHRPYHDMDPYLRQPHRERYTLTAAGGGGSVRFFTSASTEGGKGILPNDQDLRYQMRANVGFQPSSNLNVDISSAFTRYRFDLTGYNNTLEGLYFQVVRRPLNNVRSDNYAVLDSILQLQDRQANDRMILGVTATWAPIRGMSHRLTVGYDEARTEQEFVRPLNYIIERAGRIGLTEWSSRSLSTDYVASQQLSLSENFSATFSAGGQLVQREQTRMTLEGVGLPGPGEHTVSSANIQFPPEVTGERVVTGGFLLQSLFALRDRYFLTAGVRFDGYSAFGENLGTLQTYPKASASYVISEEPFWPAAWGTVKLRAAYGWAGRAPGAFDAFRTFTPQGFLGGGGSALIPRNRGNPDLAPERSRELELGVDASVFHDRLTTEVSWYTRVTDDALLAVSYPASQGFLNAQLENVGRFENRGIELSAIARLVDRGAFGIDLAATLATNFSKVLQVGSATVNTIVVGQPAPVVRLMKVRNAFAFADPVFEPDSEGFYGPNLPTHIATVAPTIRFPWNVTLTARAEYQGGAWISQAAAHFLAQRGPYGTPSCDYVYRIVPWEEYDGPYPNAARKTHPNLGRVNAVDRARCYRTTRVGDYFTWPADFLKLREVTLQAPLPFQLKGTQSTVVTLSWRNILTLLDPRNRSQDPETGATGNTVDGLTFQFLDAIPAPAEFTVSFRTTF